MPCVSRRATGVRGAEMKWSNPDRLNVYGVRMVGWPDGVPHLNPSSLSANQNQAILDALQNGTLRFVGTAEGSSTASVDAVESGGKASYGGSMDDSSDVDWDCDEFISGSWCVFMYVATSTSLTLPDRWSLYF
jgi:hypothetical protein